MQDPVFLKYVEYFKTKPMARQYYYWVGKNGVSAKDVSKKINRSIQTVTNALKDLERIGLLKSEKKGRTRIYRLKDPRLFKGLTSHYYDYVERTKKSIKEDAIAKNTLNKNLEKWLVYLSDILDGTLYTNQSFQTRILPPIKVNYTIENQNGQNLVMIFNLDNPEDLEAAMGKIFSLMISRDINPNLTVIHCIILINEKNTNASSFISLVNNTFQKLEDLSPKSFEIIVNHQMEKVYAGDLLKIEFAEKVSLKIAKKLPFWSNEALPGEDWRWDIIARRERAMSAIQNKINPKKMTKIIFSTGREISPRDAELRKILDPMELIRSYKLKEGDRFIDVGCSEGLFTIPASNTVGKNGKVYGIELSSVELKKMEEIIVDKNIHNIELINDFPEKATLKPNMADFVFYGTSLYDMYNPMKSLRNSNSTLKDNGKLIILEWKDGDTGAGPTPYGKLGKERITKFLEAASFKIETVRDENEHLYTIVATKNK